MAEFLVLFLHPFQIFNTMVQTTARPGLAETWVRYEAMFDILDQTKEALNDMPVQPPWIAEVHTAIEGMWSKLQKYYYASDKPIALIDSTLLHPALKVKFMNSAGYKEQDINRYRAEAEKRFIDRYAMT